MTPLASPRPNRKGFSLLELVAAMIILAMVIGLVVRIARSTSQLSTSILEVQRENSTRESFLAFLNRVFSSLPGNATLQLTYNDKQPGAILSDLVIQGYDMTLPWSGQIPLTVKALRIVTLPQRDGFLNIVLECYDEPVAETVKLGKPLPTPIAKVTLLRQIRFFEWRARAASSSNDDWLPDWTLSSKPVHLELMVAFGRNDPPVREIFWIPNRVDPAQFIRSVQQSVSNRRPQGNRPENPENPGQNPPPTPPGDKPGPPGDPSRPPRPGMPSSP